jgi:hypothetical protein
MRGTFLAVAVMTLCACGGTQPAGAGSSSNHPLLSSPRNYVSTPDFQKLLGLPLAAYRAGQSCAYRDQRGDTCDVTVVKDQGQYAINKAAAARYGTVEPLMTGQEGFYSATLQSPPVIWIFDFGFLKGDAYAGTLCGGRMGSNNPKP